MFLSQIRAKVQNYFHQVQQYPIRRILKTVACSALAISCAIHNFKHRGIRDCLSFDCSEINISNAHPRERAMVDALFKANNIFAKLLGSNKEDHRELLRFNIKDPRKKLLLTVSESDSNGAFDPEMFSNIIEEVNKHFDVRYQVIQSFEQACKAIRNGVKAGDLEHVVFVAHGSPYYISLFSPSENSWVLDQGIDETSDFADCFSPLPPNAKIHLLSCSTGKPQEKDPFDNIAQIMADRGKRTVFAPTDLVSAKTVFLPKDNIFSHPKHLIEYDENGNTVRENKISWFWGENLYQPFQPRFEYCSPPIDRTKLTELELEAEATIRTDLIARSLLHKDALFMEEYFQNCEDDLRKRVIVISGNDESLHPRYYAKLFRELVGNFDFLFKQAFRFSHICDAVSNVSGKEIAAIIIYGTKGSNGMLLSKDLNGKEEQIDISKDFRSCFSGLSKNAKIIFVGASLGKSGAYEHNLPQIVADTTQKVVDATTCYISFANVELHSMNPLTLYHPPHSLLGEWLLECDEKDNNLFKSFYPKI